MKQSAFITILFLFFAAVVLADTSEEHQDCPAPISVIGNHVHTSGEMMFSWSTIWHGCHRNSGCAKRVYDGTDINGHEDAHVWCHVRPA
ncbi:hypothetical protein J4G08_01240 [Candidatus Poribacteria bacterium]|nr:hypothetical protein [Candidatus Poribacteria bacterium]